MAPFQLKQQKVTVLTMQDASGNNATASSSKATKTPTGKSTTSTATTNPAANAASEYATILGMDLEKGATRFSDRVRKEYKQHSWQYW
jgi:hypothetical protein